MRRARTWEQLCHRIGVCKRWFLIDFLYMFCTEYSLPQIDWFLGRLTLFQLNKLKWNFLLMFATVSAVLSGIDAVITYHVRYSPITKMYWFLSFPDSASGPRCPWTLIAKHHLGRKVFYNGALFSPTAFLLQQTSHLQMYFRISFAIFAI